MLDTAALIKRADAWDKAHPPAGIGPVIRSVLAANLPNGANLWVQTAAQFTGKDETIDLVDGWDEDRLDYSNASRWSFGRSMDCSSVWCAMYQVIFGIQIGTYTEAQLTTLKSKAIPWAQRRSADHVLFNFKASQGRHASHAASIMGSGLIGHTTSPANPFRFEADTYGAASRVGVYRVLTDAQYQSLIVTDHADNKRDLSWWPGSFGHGATGPYVCDLKLILNAVQDSGLDPTNNLFADRTEAAVKVFQRSPGLQGLGMVGPKTRAELEVA